jgi:hypothetical protein
MNGLDLLLQNIFSYPAQKEYFTKLFIFSIDQSGKRHHLILHEKDHIPQSLSDIRIFCDKVRKGETLRNSIDRSMQESFGIPHVLQIEETALFETDYNRHGELLPRVGVKVEIPYQDISNRETQGLSISWVSDTEWEKFSRKDPVKKKIYSQQEIDEIIDKLKELDYFKFIPLEDHEKIKVGLENGLKQGKFEALEKVEDGFKHVLPDGRLFHADEEDLYDGFMHSLLEKLKPSLKREGVNISTVEETITDDDAHYIVINGMQYLMYKHEDDHDEYYYWRVATKRFLEVLNDLLSTAGSAERFYAIASGNDANIILLTPELFEYISTLRLDPFWTPYRVEDIDLEG